MEHRQGAHRRVGRFGRRVLEPLAGVSSRDGRPEEQRPDRPRIDPPLVRGGHGGADHARSAADEGVDAQQQLRRPRLRLQGRTRRRSSRSSTHSSPAARTILPWIAEYSPYALVTSDDPPIYMIYRAPPALGQDQKDPTHTANFGVKLQEKCKAAPASSANWSTRCAGREASEGGGLFAGEAEGAQRRGSGRKACGPEAAT